MTISPTLARRIYWVGIGLMVLGLADVGLFWAYRINVTGVNWSPMALGGTGMILTWIARLWPTSEPADS